MPKDSAPVVPKLGTAASRWKKQQLDLLNVEFIPQTTHSFDFEATTLSPELAHRT